MSKTWKKVDKSNIGTNQMNMSEKSREHTSLERETMARDGKQTMKESSENIRLKIPNRCSISLEPNS